MATPDRRLVFRREATWINDAMCIRDGDLGVLDRAEGPRPNFAIDGLGLVPNPRNVKREIVAGLAATTAPKTCFCLSRDPARAGGLLQYTYSDAQAIDGTDTIVLVPLTRGSVSLFPPA